MRLNKFFFGLILACGALVVMPCAAVAQPLLLPNDDAETAYNQGLELMEQKKAELLALIRE